MVLRSMLKQLLPVLPLPSTPSPGVDYSAEVRAADYAKVRDAHGEEIDMVLTWAKAVADTAAISMDAPNPLLQLH